MTLTFDRTFNDLFDSVFGSKPEHENIGLFMKRGMLIDYFYKIAWNKKTEIYDNYMAEIERIKTDDPQYRDIEEKINNKQVELSEAEKQCIELHEKLARSAREQTRDEQMPRWADISALNKQIENYKKELKLLQKSKDRLLGNPPNTPFDVPEVEQIDKLYEIEMASKNDRQLLNDH